MGRSNFQRTNWTSWYVTVICTMLLYIDLFICLFVFCHVWCECGSYDTCTLVSTIQCSKALSEGATLHNKSLSFLHFCFQLLLGCLSRKYAVGQVNLSSNLDRVLFSGAGPPLLCYRSLFQSRGAQRNASPCKNHIHTYTYMFGTYKGS